jgi:hypothetical protein
LLTFRWALPVGFSCKNVVNVEAIGTICTTDVGIAGSPIPFFKVLNIFILSTGFSAISE